MNRKTQFYREIKDMVESVKYGHRSVVDFVDGVCVRAALYEKRTKELEARKTEPPSKV
jgi:hypothetical protein